ncbi:dipeptidase [Actinoplanes sp. NPDC026623]|uniref:dipeptidase n=1 Tax=Actinoplanes sp. NPDC026623 TaxID=3155610 RepID=UPI0033E99E6A
MISTDEDVRAAIERELPGVRGDLEQLIRIPGVAFPGFDHAHLDRSAAAVAELLRGCGLEVRIARAGGQPAVIGRRPAPHGAPTVLLYAHHDVQPAGDLALWDSDPFEPVERDGRLYGRGAADDKAGVMAHVAALRALGDDLPVGVVVLVEGEEEYGSDSLDRLITDHVEWLRSDVIVVADSDNWEIGRPALTTSLRGVVSCFVEVSTPHGDVRGGPVRDALTVLSRLLSTLHDDDGEVAVDGLLGRPGTGVDYPPDRLRQEAGVLDGVRLIGNGRLADRLWTKPAIAVLGIDAPPAGRALHALSHRAKAKISVRLAPGDDPASAYAAVCAHLRARVPWGAGLEVSLESSGAPCVVDATGRAYHTARAACTTAWDGTAPVDIGIGGSIPAVAIFQRRFGETAILVTGIEDPYCAAHGPNEGLHLAEFARTCLAEALLLRNLARIPG